MNLTKDDIENQVKDLKDVYKIAGRKPLVDYHDICVTFGTRCPTNRYLADCSQCIGRYKIKDLLPIQPELTLDNLEETIIFTQLLGIEPTSK